MIALFTLLSILTTYSLVILTYSVVFDTSRLKADTILSSLQTSVLGVIGLIYGWSSLT
jgi:uncharacterized membrane protein YqjE